MNKKNKNLDMKSFLAIPKTAGQSVFSVIEEKWNYVEHAKHDPLFL